MAVGEEADTIEDVYEPYLLQQGFLMRTPRGRTATDSPSPTSVSNRLVAAVSASSELAPSAPAGGLASDGQGERSGGTVWLVYAFQAGFGPASVSSGLVRRRP